MNRTTFGTALAAVALATAVLLSSCSGGSTTAPGGGAGAGAGGATGSGATSRGSVSVKGFSFDPARIEVKAGTAVKWTNEDPTAHTITSDDGKFQSKQLEPGQSYDVTFPKAGEYDYHCSIHPSMVGQVVVK